MGKEKVISSVKCQQLAKSDEHEELTIGYSNSKLLCDLDKGSFRGGVKPNWAGLKRKLEERDWRQRHRQLFGRIC